jgi:hypothetical protein
MKFAKVLVAVLACTSLLLAQEAAAPKAEKTAKGEKKAATSTITGKFVSADAVANTIIVKVGKKDDTVAVDAAAKIVSGKETLQLADIKADSKVTVTCKMVDGKKVADKISVTAPKAEKPAKAEKKAAAEPAAAAAPAPAPAAAPVK